MEMSVWLIFSRELLLHSLFLNEQFRDAVQVDYITRQWSQFYSTLGTQQYIRRSHGEFILKCIAIISQARG